MAGNKARGIDEVTAYDALCSVPPNVHRNPYTMLSAKKKVIDKRNNPPCTVLIALQDGPCILVAHSYGGAVIMEAGTDPSVAGLVVCQTSRGCPPLPTRYLQGPQKWASD
jgi:alpha-beta hydrolase superfamily lysophospholipase